ncbi:MAG TPA: ABC transporter substrate-binding protein [Stellaceae bacterium]|nr:ABC transporter substrate-binding protein [Stellaceae bacterium]
MTRVGLIRAILLAVALLAGWVSQSPAEPAKIRIGWAVVPANIGPLMIAKAELAPHNSKSYAADFIHFAGAPQQLAALGANELDIASLAYSTFALGIENGGMSDLRVIADSFQDGVANYDINQYVVLRDGPIKKVEDLKGKVLATNGIGSSGDMAMRVMLGKHGLDPKKDVSIVEASFPAMKAMLAEKKADLITSIPPFSLDPAMQELGRTLFNQRDSMGPTQLGMLVARQGFIEKNRAALTDYLEDLVRAIRWFSDPAHHDEAVAIVADFTKQPKAQLGALFTPKGDYYRDPNGLPDLKALQTNTDTAYQLGFLKTQLTVAPYAELGPVKEAATRLGLK